MPAAAAQGRDLTAQRRWPWRELLVFALPLTLYLATAASDVAFDDAAELALCARDWSPAHPPGWPLFVTAGALWLLPAGELSAYVALSALTAVFSATGALVLYRAMTLLLGRCFTGDPVLGQNAALLAALAGATGGTVWQWSNSVEVYALQLLAVALAILGAARPGVPDWRAHALLGGGIGLGLGNHHASMVLLVPFLTGLVMTLRGLTLGQALRAMLPALTVAAGITVLAVLLLVTSAATAATDATFLFGQPDSPARLWHHLSGGFFADSLLRPGVDYAGRAIVLTEVLARHLGPFVVALAIGVVVTWRRGRGVLLLAGGYPAVLFGLQLLRMHTPNMDATLLPALAATSVLVAVGLQAILAWRRGLGLGLAIAALLLHTALGFEVGNRSGYRAGAAVLEDLSRSAPERALVLLSSWDLQTQTRLAIAERGFRPDLVVVPASFKGTHRDLLERHAPELFAAVAPEYETWLAAVAAVDPDHVYTDWFTLTSERDAIAYRTLLGKALAWARRTTRTVLCDRGTVAFLLAAGIVGGDAVSPCGVLFAIGPPPADPRPFELADGWLDHPFLLHDLCAMSALHDYRTAAQQIAGYWRHRGRAELAVAAETAHARLDAIWQRYLVGKPAPRRGR